MELTMKANEVNIASAAAAATEERKFTYQYRACGGCRKEFFSIEEYNEHSCKGHKPVASNTDDNPNPGPLTQGRMVMVNGMMVTEKPAGGMSFNGSKIGTTSNRNPMLKGEYPSQSPEKDDAKVNGMLDSIDSRLAATGKMTKMKKELASIGISCNTLNEEQTQAAYDEHIVANQKLAEVGLADVSPDEIQGDSKPTGRRASKKPKG